MKRHNRFTNRDGFTLIELMIVVIIIGVLVAMVTPRLSGRTESAKKKVAQADVDVNLATALQLYELDNGILPTTEEGLGALRTPPGSAVDWQGPYLDKKPKDPWRREYQYRSPGTHRTYDYDLFSFGRDGVESKDDIVNWEE